MAKSMRDAANHLASIPEHPIPVGSFPECHSAEQCAGIVSDICQMRKDIRSLRRQLERMGVQFPVN